jgi:hypothetical protein
VFASGASRRGAGLARLLQYSNRERHHHKAISHKAKQQSLLVYEPAKNAKEKEKNR